MAQEKKLYDQVRSVMALLLGLLVSGCGSDANSPGVQCAPENLPRGLSNEAKGLVFLPDPIAGSGNHLLRATNRNLGNFSDKIMLERLTGKGVLEGAFASVKSPLVCKEKFSAFSKEGDFEFKHPDPRFQEVMGYFHVDRYRHFLDEVGVLDKDSNENKTLEVLVHCLFSDNAFYFRSGSAQGLRNDGICMGDSLVTPGASYSDDAAVLVHEAEHATSLRNYSNQVDLQQLEYDEGGVLGEGLSDFMSLLYNRVLVSSRVPADDREFSRWALGTFFYPSDESRGAFRCPKYDPAFPKCAHFPAIQTQENQIQLSYQYPDGLGWPMTSDQKLTTEEVFLNYTAAEQIHQNSILLSGALWDAFVAMSDLGLSEQDLMSKLALVTHEALRHLETPDEENIAPVTLVGYIREVVQAAENSELFSAQELVAMKNALKTRGLFEPKQLKNNWLKVGSGEVLGREDSNSNGVFFLDQPAILKNWVRAKGLGPDVIPQSIDTGLNNKLDAGEIGVIWFDLENSSKITAGGVLVTATSLSDEIEILDQRFNPGFIETQVDGKMEQSAQVMLAKINGKAIVKSLDSIPIRPSYFGTNPFFSYQSKTGIWIRVSPGASSGLQAQFRINAKPSNGPEDSRIWKVRIR